MRRGLQVLTHGFSDEGSRMSSSMRFQADYVSAEVCAPVGLATCPWVPFHQIL